MQLKFKKGKFNLLLPRILDFISNLDEDTEYELTITKPKNPKSNDANAYYWALIGKLSEKINVSPRDIYCHHIQDIGGNYEIVPIRDDAVETWKRNWTRKGLGWVCESLGESKFRGYTNMICFYGSSTYDSRQMSRLIDLCIEDCKAQGIETLTPSQKALLMENYKEG